MAILNNNPLVGASGNQGGYNINNSLRFRSSASAYLSRTPASAGNRTTWTWSAWVKRGASDGANAQMLFGVNTGAGTYSEIRTLGDKFCFQDNSFATEFSTNAVLRDFSAWYHLMLVLDTTQATSTNRVKAYINGVEQTFAAGSYPTQNNTLSMNTANAHNIGRRPTGVSYFDGYLAEVNFIDGSAKTPSDFGETDTTTGVWKPKAYTGTYGTNGFYLKFSDIATTSGSNAGLGKDFSGNSNYWTTNNISVTSGTTYDAMTDVPTNTSATVANYCVMNPIGGNSSMTLLNGNLNTSATAYSLHRYGTIGVSSGKYYWEASPTAMSGSNNGMVVGISNDIQESGTTFNGLRGYFSNDGKAYTGTSGATYGATWTTNDIIGVALDLDAGTMVFYKNNVSQGTAFTGLTGEWFPLIRTDATVTSWINFGQRPFSYTPPTGFVALNTYNLPTPTILQGNKYMDATLWTGNGTSQTITNAGAFKPDFVWSKNRSSAGYFHDVVDSVRGANTRLCPNSTQAEDTASNAYLTAFNSNGFNIGSNGDWNRNGDTYVGWQWQAGQGTNTTNTSGSITSTVSVNTTAGFSIVTYTGTGANATVGHGLGVAPKMIIIKSRSSALLWPVWHTSLANTEYLTLNLTSAKTTGATTVWNSTTPTSSVFSIGSATGVNTNTGTYVAYCWAEIAGFSKFGSYTNNGSADGNFVYLGFRPRWIMFKNSSSTGNWMILDTARDTYNIAGTRLFADSTAADSALSCIDIVSNGFKIRATGGDFNSTTSGWTYIYAAFAENPFKNSLAR